MIELVEEGSQERLLPQIRQVQKLLWREAMNVRQHENLKFYLNHGAANINEASEMLNKCYKTGELKLKSRPTQTISLFNTADLFVNSFGTTNFDIFSIYLTNYCSLLALKEFLENGSTYQDIKSSPSLVRDKTATMRVEYLPVRVKKWRNKVAAHYAASDPKSSDNIATIMQSINIIPAYNSPYYTVGGTAFIIEGRSSQLQEWSLTKEYEVLKAKRPEFPDIPPLVSSFAK
ncbi:hypothetical protein [Colwellia piezophila]|uniref:hypothetical protein n=1 Tax=Colwellia piezophila TaxID=211668 RepID=UPI00038210D1|nr:hypothetical protein [Colwellia piezophila]